MFGKLFFEDLIRVDVQENLFGTAEWVWTETSASPRHFVTRPYKINPGGGGHLLEYIGFDVLQDNLPFQEQP